MGAWNCLQNVLYCVQQKKEIHAVLEELDGEESWPNFHFWVNYAFKENQLHPNEL